MGWHAKASGPGLPYEERGTMFGLAPRLGLGWRGEKTAGDHVSRREPPGGFPRRLMVRWPKSGKLTHQLRLGS